MSSATRYCSSCGAAHSPETATCSACGLSLKITAPLTPIHLLLQERYRILAQSGKGGSGAVYKAEDTYLNIRLVAVMDFIEGVTLENHLENMPDGRLPIGEVLEIGLLLCTVLEYLHIGIHRAKTVHGLGESKEIAVLGLLLGYCFGSIYLLLIVSLIVSYLSFLGIF